MEEYKTDRGAIERISFLTHPGESSLVDYKKGVALRSGERFAIKLVKHIIGMCNAGGGYIVVGYEEDEHKRPVAESIEPEISASYDISSLALLVESYVAGTDKISLIVHKDAHPETGVIYPIIQVEGFAKRPFFCKSKYPGILEAGALYFRIASARTVAVADSDTWEKLIDQCIEKRNEDLLLRFSSLAKEMGVLPRQQIIASTSKIEKNQAWAKAKMDGIEVVKQLSDSSAEGLMFSHWVDSSSYDWSLTQLREAAERAVVKRIGWPIGLMHDVYADEDSITCSISLHDKYDMWSLTRDGKYFYFRNFDEDEDSLKRDGRRRMLFDIRIWRISEVIDHTITLYKELGINPTEQINLNVSHLGIFGRILGTSKTIMAIDRICYAKKAEWNKKFSLDYLQSNKNDIIMSICNSLFELFEFYKPSEDQYRNIINSYRSSAGHV